MKNFFSEKTSHILSGILAGMAFMAVLGLILFGGFSGLRAAVKYAAGVRAIRMNYVADCDLDAMTDGAISGAVESLGDRWSYYMNAESYAAYKDYAANRYQGIGVTITADGETGGFLITAITKDGPAQQAGMEAGDIILAVDGVSVTGEATDFVRGLIQEDFGKNAEITALRGGQTAYFTVSCREVYASPVRYELLGGDVGYVVIANFRDGAAREAIAAVDEVIAQGAAYLVLDVRGNPGGQVSELVELLDYLLPEGDIFIRADKKGREVVEVSDADCVELPMAVLLDSESYSAAEFFAAALQEYGRAAVVGEPSTGKARSQVTVPLFDGSAVHISKFTYLTPRRRDLHEAGGVVPDVAAELTDDQRTDLATGWLEPADDPQVQAAVGALGA